MKRIIGVIGSPRHAKNTSLVVENVLAGAAQAGANTDIYYINDYDLRGCQACDGCKSDGRCLEEDGMRVFYDAIEHAQGLVFGIPIYFDHVSAQAKIFIDRLYAYVGPNMEKNFPANYKAILAFTWGDADPNLYDDVMKWTSKRLSFYFDIETVAMLKAANLEAFSEEQRNEFLERAFQAGQALTRSLA
jgi:multimeric flavodoxin WrbA